MNIDAWETELKGTFYVFANGREYKHKFTNFGSDEYRGWRHYNLDSFDITDVGVYPVTIMYGTDHDYGDVIFKGNLNVTEFKNDEFRLVPNEFFCYFKLFCPENHDGKVSIIITKDDEQRTFIKEVTYDITSKDYNKWINFTFDELGLPKEDSCIVFINVTEGGHEATSLERNIWYSGWKWEDF